MDFKLFPIFFFYMLSQKFTPYKNIFGDKCKKNTLHTTVYGVMRHEFTPPHRCKRDKFIPQYSHTPVQTA